MPQAETLPVKPVFGLDALLGKRVVLVGVRFAYIGILSDRDTTSVLLTDATVAYKTAEGEIRDWSDVQKLPHGQWYVDISAIESFGEMK